MDYVVLSAKAASFLVGVTLISFVLLAYEDEEKRMASWLERAWIGAFEREERFAERADRFVRSVLEATTRLFRRAYGAKLLSLRAFEAVICFLLGSFFLMVGVVTLGEPTGEDWLISLAGIAIGVALLVVPWLERPRWKHVLASFGVVAASLVLLNDGYVLYLAAYDEIDPGQTPSQQKFHLFIFAVMAAAIVGDYALVAMTRWLYSRAAASKSFVGMIVWAGLSTMAAPLLLFAAYSLIFLGVFHVVVSGALIELFVKLFHLVALATSFAFVALCATSVALRLLYAVVPRAIYSATKFKVLEKRKTAAGLGTLLVTPAFPQSGAVLEALVKAIG